jgi:hypothetical protein
MDLNNSMGGFKEEMPESKQKKFGEAIVEIRGIRDVQPWFLKRCGLDVSLTGDFLVGPGENLRIEAASLFKFLKNFGTTRDVIDRYLLFRRPFCVK